MALLSQMLGAGAGQQNPFAQYQQMQANPFTRQIPGSQYLGSPMPQMGPRLAPSQGELGQNVVPTDFAGAGGSLPSLPDEMSGFGFGQMAPKLNTNNSLRDNLIQDLLRNLMQSQQGGGNFGGMQQGQGMQMQNQGMGQTQQMEGF